MGRTKKYVQTDGMKVIVKYANRKLYDTSTSTYLSLSAVMKMPAGTFKVVDYATGEDVTGNVVLNAFASNFDAAPASFEAMKTEMYSKFFGG